MDVLSFTLLVSHAYALCGINTDNIFCTNSDIVAENDRRQSH